jgi:hypothetical protein
MPALSDTPALGLRAVPRFFFHGEQGSFETPTMDGKAELLLNPLHQVGDFERGFLESHPLHKIQNLRSELAPLLGTAFARD